MPLSLQKSLCRVDLPRAVCCQLSMVNVFSYFLYFSVVTTVKLGDQWPYNSLEKNLSKIGNFVCSWCCFFLSVSIWKPSNGLSRKEILLLTCWWKCSLKFSLYSQYLSSRCQLMPFLTQYHILFFFLIFWQGKLPPIT